MFSADAVLQTFGAISGGTLGAFLGGFFAVKVMKNQIEYQKEQKRLEKEDKFEKTYMLLLGAFEGFGKGVQDTCEFLLNPATDKPNYFFIAGKLMGLLEAAKENMAMVNHDYIPKDIYMQYLRGKNTFEICAFNIPRLVEVLKEEDKMILKKSSSVEDLNETAKKLRQVFNEIEKFKYENVA